MNNNSTSATLFARALRLALCGAALIACASNSIAQENPSPTPEAAPPDCKVNDPDIAASYSGECRNGLANGKGTATGRDKYVGEFRDGLQNGKGDYAWDNGNHYVGDWVNGKKTGKGVFTWPNGDRYEGDWANDKMSGRGIYTKANGERREGDFVDDRFVGKSMEIAQNTAQAGAAQPASAMQTKSDSELTNKELMPQGMWKDPKTGLIWARCMAGQSWSGSACTGELLKRADYDYVIRDKTEKPFYSMTPEAQFVKMISGFDLGGFKDWRPPTISELQALYRCSDGSQIPEAAGENVYFVCKDNKQPRLDNIFDRKKIQPLASTASAGDCGGRLCNGSLNWITTHIGSNGNLERYGSWTYLVRSDTPQPEWEKLKISAAKSIGEFEKAKTEMARILQREEEQRKIREAEAERQRQAEERKWQAELNGKDPQAMYLKAGNLVRNGDSYKGKQMYEAIIRRFPRSQWAVKASDQLSASAQSSSQKSNACAHVYVGKRFKGGIFGANTFTVLGFSPESERVTVRDSIMYSTQETSCSNIPQ